MIGCFCRTPEKNGEVKHKGKLYWVFVRRFVDDKLVKISVCDHHRKFYKGWKKAKRV